MTKLLIFLTLLFVIYFVATLTCTPVGVMTPSHATTHPCKSIIDSVLSTQKNVIARPNNLEFY